MTPKKIMTREYKPEDVQALANIYYNTIHQINIQHYTDEQVEAWAPQASLETQGWKKKFEKSQPLVALIGETVVGFAEFEPNGHIDCFYTHHEHIGCGIGSALMAAIFNRAAHKKIRRIFVEASITAKPFFEKQGFTVIEEQQVDIHGIKLTNYKMEKIIGDFIS